MNPEDDEIYDGFDDDEGEYEFFDCGKTADGFCTKAGSEECDWDCPYSGDL